MTIFDKTKKVKMIYLINYSFGDSREIEWEYAFDNRELAEEYAKERFGDECFLGDHPPYIIGCKLVGEI